MSNLTRPTNVVISALCWVPDFARGYVKDLRVRWALEEAGLPYETHLIMPDQPAASAYRRWQPFGQVPAYRDDGIELFESGAILLYLAERCPELGPTEPLARARVTSWLLAAQTSLQAQLDTLIHYSDALEATARQGVAAVVGARLADFERCLADREYLEHTFSVGDLMLATVLREAEAEDLLVDRPGLVTYLRRCLSRPAFEVALNAQLADLKAEAPDGHSA